MYALVGDLQAGSVEKLLRFSLPHLKIMSMKGG